MLLVLREKRFQERKASIPLYYLLSCCGFGCVGVDAQLLLVATTRCARNSFEVVVDSDRSATTTSWMWSAMLWRRLSFQMLLTLAQNR
jgi:hypothetical protein